MPNILKQFFIPNPPPLQAPISLTLTDNLYHSADITSDIKSTLKIHEPTIASQPQIQVSLTHA